MKDVYRISLYCRVTGTYLNSESWLFLVTAACCCILLSTIVHGVCTGTSKHSCDPVSKLKYTPELKYVLYLTYNRAANFDSGLPLKFAVVYMSYTISLGRRAHLDSVVSTSLCRYSAICMPEKITN